MGDASTQRKEREVGKCNGQAAIDNRAPPGSHLLLVRHHVFEVTHDSTLLAGKTTRGDTV